MALATLDVAIQVAQLSAGHNMLSATAAIIATAATFGFAFAFVLALARGDFSPLSEPAHSRVFAPLGCRKLHLSPAVQVPSLNFLHSPLCQKVHELPFVQLYCRWNRQGGRSVCSPDGDFPRGPFEGSLLGLESPPPCGGGVLLRVGALVPSGRSG